MLVCEAASTTAAASSASTTAAEADLKDFLQRTYDMDLAKTNKNYEAHIMATRELHEAQVHLMKSKLDMQKIKAKLRAAQAAAVDATAAVDCKKQGGGRGRGRLQL
jgi:hypothetical protein